MKGLYPHITKAEYYQIACVGPNCTVTMKFSGPSKRQAKLYYSTLGWKSNAQGPHCPVCAEEMQTNGLPWQEFAESLGYPDKRTMLTTMYLDNLWSLDHMGKVIGCDKETVKYQLNKLEVPLRPIGGANNLKHGKFCGEYAKVKVVKKKKEAKKRGVPLARITKDLLDSDNLKIVIPKDALVFLQPRHHDAEEGSHVIKYYGSLYTIFADEYEVCS